MTWTKQDRFASPSHVGESIFTLPSVWIPCGRDDSLKQTLDAYESRERNEETTWATPWELSVIVAMARWCESSEWQKWRYPWAEGWMCTVEEELGWWKTMSGGSRSIGRICRHEHGGIFHVEGGWLKRSTEEERRRIEWFQAGIEPNNSNRRIPRQWEEKQKTRLNALPFQKTRPVRDSQGSAMPWGAEKTKPSCV